MAETIEELENNEKKQEYIPERENLFVKEGFFY